MNEELMKEVQGIVTKQRELAETVGTDSAAYKSYMEKTDEAMAKFEEKNAEFVKSYEAGKKEAKEMADRVKHLEGIISTGMGAGAGAEDLVKSSTELMGVLLQDRYKEYIEDPSNQTKAAGIFNVMAKMDYTNSEDGQKMASFLREYGTKASNDLIRSDIGEYGGFLCPPEYASELNRTMIEFSPVRQFARVKRTSSKVYREPIRLGIPQATRPGEAREGGSSGSNYGMNDFTPHRLTNTIGITYDELYFNAYDVANELMRDNADAFSVTEGQEFFNGDGVEKGKGWSVDANVPEYESATSTLSFDDIIKITGELKRGYDPMFMFNRKTLAYLRTLKDSGGRYLWNPAFGDAASGAPATINGFRYSADFIEFNDVDVADGFPILFADMPRFYQIVDRTDMTVIRDEYTQKKNGIVEFTMNKWCVGKPKIYEAGIRLKKIS